MSSLNKWLTQRSNIGLEPELPESQALSSIHPSNHSFNYSFIHQLPDELLLCARHFCNSRNTTVYIIYKIFLFYRTYVPTKLLVGHKIYQSKEAWDCWWKELQF